MTINVSSSLPITVESSKTADYLLLLGVAHSISGTTSGFMIQRANTVISWFSSRNLHSQLGFIGTDCNAA
jgi:hypothetical protein